jgi:NadR type nicotinamide-nucleotide adenylyltransferase
VNAVPIKPLSSKTQRNLSGDTEVYRVVITGPESTGKTSLALTLASRFKTAWIPEYAREYISGLGRKYNYTDIEHIAREQVRREKEFICKAKDFLFYDTYLVVTKIWFKVKYGHYPQWIDEAILRSGIDLFLICNIDIPWIADPVRENGGEMREKLLEMYKEEISSFGIPWEMVSGRNDQRTYSAINILNEHFNL